MMEDIRRYLIAVTAAAIICGIISSIIGKNGAYGAIVKMLCGLFLSLTLIAPITGLRFSDINVITDELKFDADSIVTQAQTQTNTAIGEVIMTQTEAYVLDKAESLGAQVAIDVMLSPEDMLTPESVIIRGTVSPYAKQILQQYISDTLNIPKEKQQWI